MNNSNGLVKFFPRRESSAGGALPSASACAGGNSFFAKWSDVLFLFCICSAIFFIFLSSRPLLVPEEGRYAEIIREMFISHDYVTPYLDGVKYFEKPILFYWFGLAAVKIFGLHVLSLRLVSAVMAVLGCVLTYLTARTLYDRDTGIFAALILSASGLYLGMSQIINVDMTVTFFLTLSLFSFLLGVQQEQPRFRRILIWTAFAAAGLGVLAKGLVGIIFPIMIVGLWILILQQWRILRTLYLPSAIFIFLCVTIPWHVLVSLRHPEFAYFYFIQQQFLRFATLEVGHYQPVWFFLPVLLAGFFPWIFFLPQTLAALFKQWRLDKKIAPIDLFFLIWIAAIFIFFSLSKSKLVSYILPIFPPLAILVAHYFASRHFSRIKLALLWCATLVFIFSVIPLIAAKNTESILPLVTVLKSKITPQSEIVAFRHYYQDLPFYLERRVTVVDWRGELAFGSQHQNVQDWLIDEDLFWQKWRKQASMFVLTDREKFVNLQKKFPAEKFCQLGATANTVLFTRC